MTGARSHAEYSESARQMREIRRARDYASGGHGSTPREPIRGRTPMGVVTIRDRAVHNSGQTS